MGKRTAVSFIMPTARLHEIQKVLGGRDDIEDLTCNPAPDIEVIEVRQRRTVQRASPARDAVLAFIRAHSVGSVIDVKDLEEPIRLAGCLPSSASPTASWMVGKGYVRRLPGSKLEILDTTKVPA